MNEKERKPLGKRKKQAGTRTVTKRKSPGAEELRKAAGKALAKNSKLIVNNLSSSSVDGNLQSTKLLYELAELSEERGEGQGARKFRSMASKWASEPQWSGDQREGHSEPSKDGRDTENQPQHNA
jgi:hypothetical protein